MSKMDIFEIAFFSIAGLIFYKLYRDSREKMLIKQSLENIKEQYKHMPKNF